MIQKVKEKLFLRLPGGRLLQLGAASNSLLRAGVCDYDPLAFAKSHRVSPETKHRRKIRFFLQSVIYQPSSSSFFRK
jgi:hypothetical protein